MIVAAYSIDHGQAKEQFTYLESSCIELLYQFTFSSLYMMCRACLTVSFVCSGDIFITLYTTL